MVHKISLISSATFVLIMAFLAIQINFLIPPPDTMSNQDIYFSFVEGQRLRNGEDPYSRILTGDMLNNNKYATYFPVFYELSYISQNLGLQAFQDWMVFWRLVFMAFELATAGLLYFMLARRNLEWAGVLASGFWLFNRWTLQVVQTQNMDFIPIFFLLLSLELFPRRQNLSMLFFGLSLGFKQIAIFLLPLYLIWVYRAAGKEWFKQLSMKLALIASIPFVAAIPFLIWDAKGFVKSVLFSATRLPGSFFPPQSLDVLLGWTGLPARIVMVAFLLLMYAIAWKGYSEKYISSFLAMLIFLAFNTALFAQYEAWVFALAPLFFCDLYELGRRVSAQAAPASGQPPV